MSVLGYVVLLAASFLGPAWASPSPLVSPTEIEVDFHYVLPGPNGSLQNHIAADGTLVWFGRALPREELPPRAALALRAQDEPLLLAIQLRILAFELERPSRPGFQREEFIDTLGRTLLVIEKADGEDTDRELEDLLQLASTPRSAIEAIVASDEITRLQIENEWGEEVVAAKWIRGEFTHEVKVTMDGHPLFVEIDSPKPLPTPVRSALKKSQGAEIEAMILYAYGLVDPDSSRIVGMALANGISLEVGQRSYELDRQPTSESRR